MPSRAANRLTQAHGAELAALGAVVEQEVRRIARTVTPADVDAWWLRVLPELLELVAAAFAGSRTLGARYLRQHAALEGRSVDPVLAQWSTDRARTSLRVTGPVEFKRHVASGRPAPARSMETMLAGGAQRLALAGERETVADTIDESEAIVGWRRVTDADPCAFCALLASRGAVYRSAESAGGVVGRRGVVRGSRQLGMSFHDHDQCTVEPLYVHEQEPPEVDELREMWERVTAGRSGAAAIREWRRWWDEHRRAVPDLGERERRPQDRERQEREQAERERAEVAEQLRGRIDVRGNEARRDVVAELDRQVQLTPRAAAQLRRVDQDFQPDHVTRSALAYVDLNFQEMHLHPDWSQPNGPMWQAARESRESGWWTPSGADSPLGTVVAHEYGHHVTTEMWKGVTRAEARRLLATIRDQLGIPVEVEVDVEDPFFGGAAIRQKITEAVKDHPRVVTQVSAYAATDGDELLAEVWQEYSTMGDRARPHIRAIGRVMQEMAEGGAS